MDMKDFIKRAEFRTDPHHGVVANFEGKDYEIVPDGTDAVRVVGDEGETLGRITLGHSGFVPA